MRKLKNRYDVIVVGSGLGGLVSANILAKQGYHVCVLEKNNQFGGNLQTFVRDKNIFDTGVHYIGGLNTGENLNRYFRYLGIMDELKISRMDCDKFDVITFDNHQKEYFHAQGYDNFIEKLSQDFPKERDAITTYCQKIQDVCNSFPLYNLEANRLYDQNVLRLKVKEYLDSITNNELLKSVLAGSNFLYAGNENTPFYVHALSTNSYIQSSWRCVNGGGQIAKLLVKKLKEHGGEAYKRQEVIKFGFEDKKLSYIETQDQNKIFADLFISNIEPKLTVKLLKGEGMRKAYVNRINQIKSTISAFSLYLVFKPESFQYINYNYYHFKDSSHIWNAQDYTQNTWPEGYMISMGVKKDQNKWAQSMTIMTYMRFDEVKPWENTFNTVVAQTDRGKSYEKFRQEKAEKLLDEVEKKYPNIRNCIQSVHISTPLSYRDYIGSNQGAMYGYVKDADNPMKSFLSPNTKLKNLFFTGQSLNMHGILGVTISAVLTCAQIVGREKLINEIVEEIGE